MRGVIECVENAGITPISSSRFVLDCVAHLWQSSVSVDDCAYGPRAGGGGRWGAGFPGHVMAGMDGGARAPGAGALARLDAGGAGGASAGMQARAKRDYVRRAYCQKLAMVQRACRRIEAGWSLAEVCREPDMPGRSTFVSWLRQEPELRAMVEAAEAAAAEVFLPRRDLSPLGPGGRRRGAGADRGRAGAARGVRRAGHARAFDGVAVDQGAARVRGGLPAGAGGAGGPAVRPGLADRLRGDGGRGGDGAAEDPDAEVAGGAAGAAGLWAAEGAGPAPDGRRRGRRWEGRPP
jgi:hypothetical protein